LAVTTTGPVILIFCCRGEVIGPSGDDGGGHPPFGGSPARRNTLLYRARNTLEKEDYSTK
jgi:hypothetical protein